MPIVYDYDERTITHARRKIRKFSSSPGVGTGFLIGIVTGFIVLPIVLPIVGYQLTKRYGPPK